MLRNSTPFGLFVIWLATAFLGHIAFSQEPLTSVDALQNEIKKASQLFKERKLAACVESVDLCTLSIQKLSENADPKDAADLKKLHTQIAKAHELLTLDGAELAELPPWEKIAPTKGNKPKPSEPPTPKPSGTPGAVSFIKDIAPWMVEQCSRCHIARSQADSRWPLLMIS